MRLARASVRRAAALRASGLRARACSISPFNCGSLKASHQRSRSIDPGGARSAGPLAPSKAAGMATSAGRAWAQAPRARQAIRTAETRERMAGIREWDAGDIEADREELSPLVAAENRIGCRARIRTSSDMNTQAQ